MEDFWKCKSWWTISKTCLVYILLNQALLTDIIIFIYLDVIIIYLRMLYIFQYSNYIKTLVYNTESLFLHKIDSGIFWKSIFAANKKFVGSCPCYLLFPKIFNQCFTFIKGHECKNKRIRITIFYTWKYAILFFKNSRLWQ